MEKMGSRKAIFSMWPKNFSDEVIFENLRENYSTTSPCYMTIKKSIIKFRIWWINVQVAPRADRLGASTCTEIVEKIEVIVKNNPKILTDFRTEDVKVNDEHFCRILKNNLHHFIINASYVAKNLIFSQKKLAFTQALW